MAKKLSSGMVDYISQEGGITQALANGVIHFYSGTQPASANDASTGTLLCTFTKGGATPYTAETRATATVTIGGSSGTLASLKIGGVELLPSAVAFVTDTTATASAVKDAINNNLTIPDYKATSSGAVVTIIAPKNSGNKLNGLAITSSVTLTLTASVNAGANSNFGDTTGSPAGVVAGASATNGLNFIFPNSSAGVAVKEVTAWSGTAVASDSAGWFRFQGDSISPSGASTTAIRFDGSIGTSGTDLIVSSTTITSGAVQTINSFTINTLQAQ